jgi:hypothetical protein
MRVFRLCLALGLAAGLAGCRSADFERLAFEVVPVCVRTEEAGERVFRTEAEWTTFLAAHHATAPPGIDFGQRMVVSRFDGGGSACTSWTVEDALVTDGVVVVQATRHLFEGPCIAVLAFPQVTVSVERRDLPVQFRVREVRTSSTGAGSSCY